LIRGIVALPVSKVGEINLQQGQSTLKSKLAISYLVISPTDNGK
jgi:hypothetical protein